jgi:hypothetical protein
MHSEPLTTKTIRWFGSNTEHSGSSPSHQYTLIASETINLESSTSELVTGVVDVLIDVIEPAAGQTTSTWSIQTRKLPPGVSDRPTPHGGILAVYGGEEVKSSTLDFNSFPPFTGLSLLPQRLFQP